MYIAFDGGFIGSIEREEEEITPKIRSAVILTSKYNLGAVMGREKVEFTRTGAGMKSFVR